MTDDPDRADVREGRAATWEARVVSAGGRLLLIATLGALAAAACLLGAYACWPQLVLSMDDEPPLTRGLYPVERAPDGVTFAWSRDEVTVLLHDIDRHLPWEFDIRFRGSRENEAELPGVQVAVDGVVLAERRASNDFQALAVTLPVDDLHPRTARVVMRVSATFTPGPGDPRPLGVMVDEIRVRPAAGGIPIAPWRLVRAAAMAGAICGVMFGLIGLTAGSAAAAAGVLAVGQAAVLVTGAGPYTAYSTLIPAIAGSVAAGTVIATLLARWQAGAPLRRTARFVLACSGGVLFLKLLILLHPNMPIGDALFQAHRFEWVRDGRWLFTSIAPGGYEFPYAIALYVFALPFASLAAGGAAGVMALLRIIVASADVVAGALLYPAIARSWSGAIDATGATGTTGAKDTGPDPRHARGDRLAGAIAVGLFHLIPLNFQVQTVGNLTNAFGQSLFVIAIAGLLLGLLRPAAYGRLALLTLLMAAAFLSHTSTFAIAAPAFLLAAHAFWWHGKPEARRLALPLLLATVVASILAVALYYGHFGETYVAQWRRISGEMAAPAELSDPGGRSIAARAAVVPYYLQTYFGWPALVLAAAGLPILWRRDLTGLTVAGWLASAAGFLALGVLTPVDMRYYLAAFPAVAMLGGFGAARAWRRGPVFQSASVVLLLAAFLLGARHALAALR
jgi:hypothetical protein